MFLYLKLKLYILCAILLCVDVSFVGVRCRKGFMHSCIIYKCQCIYLMCPFLLPLRGRDCIMFPRVWFNLSAPPFPMGWYAAACDFETPDSLSNSAMSSLWPPEQNGHTQGAHTHKRHDPTGNFWQLVSQFDLYQGIAWASLVKRSVQTSLSTECCLLKTKTKRVYYISYYIIIFHNLWIHTALFTSRLRNLKYCFSS